MLVENDCRALTVSMEALLQDFEPTEALPYMEAADIFDEDHVEALTKLNRRALRVQQFLRVYRQKANDLEPLVRFFMDNKQPHLAKLIERSRNIKAEDRPVPSEDRLIMRLLKSGIPVQCKHHISRDDLLESLKDSLIDLSTEEHFWLVIHGMPGCGKSCLAADVFATYGELFRYYEDIFWISGDSCETVEGLPSFYGNFFTSISDAVMLTGREPSGNLHAQVRLALLEKPNALFVLDNVIFEESVRWFDQLRCRILVTSRNVDIFQASNAKVVLFPMTTVKSGFTLKELSDFFASTHSPDDSFALAKEPDLYKRLHLKTNGLPALVNIMAVLSRNSYERLEWLCSKMETESLRTLDCITCYRYSNLANAIAYSFDLLCEAEKDLLRCMVLFPSNTWIPVQVIDLIAPVDVCGSRESIFETLQILEVLAKRSMVEERRSIEEDGCPYEYLLHPVVENFLCSCVENEFLDSTDLLISRIEAYLRKKKPRNGYHRVQTFYEMFKLWLRSKPVRCRRRKLSVKDISNHEFSSEHPKTLLKPCSFM